jgi:predicted RNase H-like HicB family nuclease
MIYRVLAHWDAEANVWWAESQDVKGLVAEANTFEELARDLREIVPELLELNHGIDRIREETKIVITADRTETLLPA